MNNLIAFDLDGTLYRTETSFHPAVNKILKKHDLPEADTSVIESFIGEPGYVFENWLSGLSKDIAPNVLDKEIYALELEEIRRCGSLYDGALKLLRELKHRGYLLGICSNCHQAYLDTIVDHFKLMEFMDFIELPAIHKETKSESLKRVSAQYDLRQGFMVGDRYHDIMAARDNGFISIGAAYGFGGKEVKEADYQIAQLGDVISVVDLALG